MFFGAHPVKNPKLATSDCCEFHKALVKGMKSMDEKLGAMLQKETFVSYSFANIYLQTSGFFL